jgi:hypothetical protein
VGRPGANLPRRSIHLLALAVSRLLITFIYSKPRQRFAPLPALGHLNGITFIMRMWQQRLTNRTVCPSLGHLTEGASNRSFQQASSPAADARRVGIQSQTPQNYAFETDRRDMYLFHLVLAPPPTFRLASRLFADRRRTVLRLCVLWRVGSTPTLNGFAFRTKRRPPTPFDINQLRLVVALSRHGQTVRQGMRGYQREPNGIRRDLADSPCDLDPIKRRKPNVEHN